MWSRAFRTREHILIPGLAIEQLTEGPEIARVGYLSALDLRDSGQADKGTKSTLTNRLVA
jgi:hypothetical protein